MDAKYIINEKINQMKQIQENLLYFLEDEEADSDQITFLEDEEQIIRADKCYLKEFLHLISKISNYHHRSKDFIIKTEKIILKFEQEIKKYYTNFDIFNIFKGNKRILLFLFERQIIKPEKLISSIITNYKYTKRNYPQYFQIEFQFSNVKIGETDIESYKEKRRTGENDSYICQLIQKDLVNDFISYVNRTNFPLNSKIKKSIYETNIFLMDKTPKLIEYAAFFGSVQIFKYLIMNDVVMTSSLWPYVIHGNNADIFHMMEDQKIHFPDEIAYNCYFESIKCHHINIMNYIRDNFDINYNKDIFMHSLRYHNHLNIDDEYEFKITRQYWFNLIKFDYIRLFEFLLNNKLINLYKHKITSKKPDVGLYKTCFEKVLHHAVIQRKTELVEILLSKDYINANEVLDITNKVFDENFRMILKKEKEKNPLLLAIKDENETMINILMSNPKTDINMKLETIDYVTGISSKESILNYLVRKGKIEGVKKILSHPNIDVNAKTIKTDIEKQTFIDSKTSLCIAIENQNIQMIDLLLSNENIDFKNILMNVNEKGRTTKNALFAAVDLGNLEILTHLLSKECYNINDKTIETLTDQTKVEHSLLSYSVLKGKIEIIQFLISQPNIDINMRLTETRKGKNKEYIKTEQTILRVAILKGNQDIIKLLLSHKDININAKSIEYYESCEIIKRKKSLNKTKKINKNIIKQRSVLHDAVEFNKNEFINIFLEQKGINVFAQDEKGKTPIDYSNDEKIIKLFINKN